MNIIHRLKKLEQSAIPKCSENHLSALVHQFGEPEPELTKCSICGEEIFYVVVRLT